MECMRNHFIDGALLDGRFRTLSPLNHGSFGMVFKALDTATGELVALKCLTKPSAANTCPQMIAVDDRSEELAIHKLVGAHPNIVNLVHHFETEHHVYIVLEYCSNGDLYEAIRIGRGPGQTENVREAMFQLVDAVQYMHSKGVYHRDIKPENIFLDKNGTLKIGDFGLATMDRWSYEAAVGSDRYMAPEQYDPANCGYSPAKADIWAIGICMLNILFSRNPFATPTVSDPLFSDFAHDNQSLFDVFPNMSQDTFEVIVSCLALDPAKRSLSAVRSALQRAVAFTTDEEPLDDFCVEDPTVVETTSTREPLRTPSISTPHLDQNGAFPWAKALALTPPVRQLSAIPDTENSDDFELFPSDPQSDWYSVSGSIPSFVDSGLGFSLKSDKLSGYVAMKSTRPKAVPKTSGSLPISMARPIPSMASVFGKKREAVSKSWSDLWDEDAEEEQVLFGRIPEPIEEQEPIDEEELDHDLVFLRSGEDDKVWEADLPEDPITPRPALKELKNLDSVNNSRSHSPKASSKRARETPRDKEHVSEFTGFVFEEHNEDGTSSSALSNVPRYSPPSKRSMVDKWAALGDRRRAVPNGQSITSSGSRVGAKRGRAGSWKKNAKEVSSPSARTTPSFQHASPFASDGPHGGSHDFGVWEQLQNTSPSVTLHQDGTPGGLGRRGLWNIKDWRRQLGTNTNSPSVSPIPAMRTGATVAQHSRNQWNPFHTGGDASENEWVWRHDLHL